VGDWIEQKDQFLRGTRAEGQLVLINGKAALRTGWRLAHAFELVKGVITFSEVGLYIQVYVSPYVEDTSFGRASRLFSRSNNKKANPEYLLETRSFREQWRGIHLPKKEGRRHGGGLRGLLLNSRLD